MAVQKTSFTFPSSSRTPIDVYCHVWRDDSRTPIGVIQFFHGLTEYSGIFRDLAAFLAEQGYICIGIDLLGFGYTAGAGNSCIAPNDSHRAIYKDMLRFHEIVNERYPDLPHFVYGHSMGAIGYRGFLGKYADKVDVKACFLSADSCLPGWFTLFDLPLYVVGRILFPSPKLALALRKKFYKGPVDYGDHPPLLWQIALCWIAFDKQDMRNFVSDPYICGANGWLPNALGFALKNLNLFVDADKYGWAKKIPDDLVIHHGCGRWDVCGFFGIGPTLVHRHLKKAGKKTELKLYSKAMHEPFAEGRIRDEFFGDVLTFFNRNNPLAQ